MTRAPMVMGKAGAAWACDPHLYDTTLGWRFVNPGIDEQYGSDPMSETAENLAREEPIVRADQDAFALRSQERAAKAVADGRLAREIVAVTVPGRHGDTVVTVDEHPRDTSLEALARLRPIREGGTVTVGNASGINDGAAALLVASQQAVDRYGLAPLAWISAIATRGRRAPDHGHRAGARNREAARAHGARVARHRRDRAQRGVRSPGARSAPSPGPAG